MQWSGIHQRGSQMGNEQTHGMTSELSGNLGNADGNHNKIPQYAHRIGKRNQYVGENLRK